MWRTLSTLALLSWFTGGVLLGLIETIPLPKDPNYSTTLQLLPLLLLLGGIWLVITQYQRLSAADDRASKHLRDSMNAGWLASFGVNAGIGSLNNISTEIFHLQIPYYFQGVSLAQKIIALLGIFVLGTASALTEQGSSKTVPVTDVQHHSDFWEKPLTNIGFISLLLGVVLGLAQYWLPVVFAGLILLLAGVMLYPIGRLTEKNVQA